MDAISAGLGGSAGAARSGARREDALSLGTAFNDEDSVVEASGSGFLEPNPLAPFIQPKMPREPRRRWWSLPLRDARVVAGWDSVNDWASGRGAVPSSA